MEDKAMVAAVTDDSRAATMMVEIHKSRVGPLPGIIESRAAIGMCSSPRPWVFGLEPIQRTRVVADLLQTVRQCAAGPET